MTKLQTPFFYAYPTKIDCITERQSIDLIRLFLFDIFRPARSVEYSKREFHTADAYFSRLTRV